MLTWDNICKKQPDEFETKIRGIEWEDLSNKYLYTWDGNHRLAAWTKVIKQGNKFSTNLHSTNRFYVSFSKKLKINAFSGNFENDLDRHLCVKVTLVHADLKNQAGLMHMVARLNK